MKVAIRFCLTALMLCLLPLAGCSGTGALTAYEATYYDLFDTITVLKGYAKDEAAFRKEAQAVYDTLLTYHRLFDIYHAYEDVVNLKTINDSAGMAPVTGCDPRLMDFLLFCKEVAQETDDTVDVTLGGVLSLWHDARERALSADAVPAVPDFETLSEARAHCGIQHLIIDREAGSVYLDDAFTRLDVGALGKGYASARVAEMLPEGYLLSLGGNVVTSGAKPDGSAWNVGIRDPLSEEGELLHTVAVTAEAVVSSGDYERFFESDGVRYHHIIDPVTLYPGDKWRGVSVIAKDAAMADALSTALFLMDLDAGKALLSRHEAEAVWVDADGSCFYSDGYEHFLTVLPF